MAHCLWKETPLHSSMCWLMQSIKQCFLCTSCWCSEHGHRANSSQGCSSGGMQGWSSPADAATLPVSSTFLNFHCISIAKSWEIQLETFVTAGRASPSKRIFTKFPMPESFCNSRQLPFWWRFKSCFADLEQSPQRKSCCETGCSEEQLLAPGAGLTGRETLQICYSWEQKQAVKSKILQWCVLFVRHSLHPADISQQPVQWVASLPMEDWN